MTFLEAINEVLERLRESSVATINQNAYASMIGHMINDAKRQVEDAWDWDDQNTTIAITTVGGTSGYTLTGSGTRQKGISANITTVGRQGRLMAVSSKWIQDQQQLATITNSAPSYFAWDGNNGTDSKVQLFATPDSAYTIAFNLNVPQVALTAASDVINVPADAVVMGAYARALVERGEDGALSSSEAYSLYKSILADRIAIEQARNEDFSLWMAT